MYKGHIGSQINTAHLLKHRSLSYFKYHIENSKLTLPLLVWFFALKGE